jgi:superoxide reductase
MQDLKSQLQSADWKSEKHVPVIEAPAAIKAGEVCTVKVTVGKEIAHPNTTAHHIRWIDVYFLPEGAKHPFQIGKAEFTAHGESPEGPDTSTVSTQSAATLSFRTGKPGTILAASYCNIHGLWQGAAALAVQ